MATATKITRQDIIDILEWTTADNDPGKFTLSKSVFTIRKEYFWRPSKFPQESFKNTKEKLEAAGLILSNVEYGDHYASFKGGKGVKDNSHYWFKFKAHKE